MADLKEARSSNMTAEGGRLFHCTIAKGEIITYSNLKLSVFE